MAPASNNPVADDTLRPPRRSRRLWLLFGAFVAGSVVLTALSEWRDSHGFLINASDSLPNWAFLIQRRRLPEKGEYVFFSPPAGGLLRRHFGKGPLLFGKIVYGVAGDVVGRAGLEVTINGAPVARLKPRTRLGEPLTPGATGAIPGGCFFVGTPHKDGFDSRYAEIGLVCSRQIVGTGVPVL